MAKEESIIDQIHTPGDDSVLVTDQQERSGGASNGNNTTNDMPMLTQQNASSGSTSGGINRTSEERTTPITSTNGNNSQGQNTRICRFYKSKSCKHGVKGDGCKFAHPKKCQKFIRHGDKSNRGCKKGKRCSDFHPPLCWSSLKDGWCDRQNCKFHHIQGTRFPTRTDAGNNVPVNTMQQSCPPLIRNRVRQGQSYASVTDRQSFPCHEQTNPQQSQQ